MKEQGCSDWIKQLLLLLFQGWLDSLILSLTNAASKTLIVKPRNFTIYLEHALSCWRTDFNGPISVSCDSQHTRRYFHFSLLIKKLTPRHILLQFPKSFSPNAKGSYFFSVCHYLYCVGYYSHDFLFRDGRYICPLNSFLQEMERKGNF